MSFEWIGLGWKYPIFWLLAGGTLYFFCLAWHGRKLFRTTLRKQAWKLILLRGLSGLIFLVLIARPSIDQLKINPDAVRVVSLVDLSGSMNQRDKLNGESRINLIRPFLDLQKKNSWINQIRERYGAVDRFGFADDEVNTLLTSSWDIPSKGKSTSLGNALSHVLESTDSETPGAIVLFSDGRNNLGQSPLEVAEQYRYRGIPVNVIGVGEIREFGNLSVKFTNFPSKVVAKEQVIFSAQIHNGFEYPKKTIVRLLSNDLELENRSLKLSPGESRIIQFSPHVPEIAGIRTFRVVVDSLGGDFDASDDSDSEVVQVLPPSFFSALFLSHKVTPFYPFLKRSLSGDRFQLSSLIRLGEQTFHARGENVSPEGYPKNPDFWMDFDVVLIDSGSLRELNATMVKSLKNFVHKRGGGLLLFGQAKDARELLGGLMPALETNSALAKQNLSLFVLPEPLFAQHKHVDEWKPFLPAGLPAELITRVNPAARDVVSLQGDRGKSVLTLQAYGAGKSAYWGSPHDWRRSLADEARHREFSFFWSGVVEWLGSGTVERIKVEEQGEFGSSGEENHLVIDVLGQDFEPSMDARIKANITGPDQYSKSLQLYPQGGALGRYTGKFIPPTAGSYRIHYDLLYPDGEKLMQLSYLKIKEHGDESKDTRYAERELRMLANLTGGEFVDIKNFNDQWTPKLSASLPTVRQRSNLADLWPLSLILFLAAGFEWIMRRKVGFR